MVVSAIFAITQVKAADVNTYLESRLQAHFEKNSKQLRPTGSKESLALYFDTGFLTVNSYGVESCAGGITYQTGYEFNTCVVLKNFAYKLLGLADGCENVDVVYYSDRKCSVELGTVSFESTAPPVVGVEDPLAYCYGVQEPIYGLLASFDVACSISSSPPVAAGALLQQLYEDDNCTATTGFKAFAPAPATANCMPLSSNSSLQFNCGAGLHVVTSFDGAADCSGTASFVSAIDSTCTAQESEDSFLDDQDGGDYNVKLQAQPTSGAFAFFCVPEGNYVRFQASQVINGVSLVKYQTNQKLYDLTLKQTIAKSMGSSVGTGSILNLVVTSATSGAAAGGRRLATGGAINAAYEVLIANSALTSAQVLAALKAAIASGDFNTYMHAFANANGAVYLLDALSGDLQALDESAPSTGGDAPVMWPAVVTGVLLFFAGFFVIILRPKK